jgi:hypothetical protein
MPALATVTFPNVTGVVEDSVVNNFTLPFLDDAASNPEMSDTTNAIVAFYNSVASGASAAIGTYLSDALSRAASACTIRYYDISGHLDGSPHGSPWAIANWTLTGASSSNQLPHEVAFCVTMEAFGRSDAAVEAPDGADSDFLIDRPKQRRTGRIYLGPLTAGASDSTASQCRPLAQFMTDVRAAMLALDNALFLAGAGGLGVWSRKDAAVMGLEAISTDDAWDTQRRRGVAATARTRVLTP